MQSAAGEVAERLGHEGGDQSGPVCGEADQVAEDHDAVGGAQRLRVAEVVLELAVGVLVVVGVVLPAHGVDGAADRGQVVQRPAGRVRVVAGPGGVVQLVRHPDAAVLGTAHQEVLGLGARLQFEPLFGELGELPAQDAAGRVRPGLAPYVQVALEDAEILLDRHPDVGGGVGNRHDVRIGRALPQPVGGVPGEPEPLAEQPVEGVRGRQLGTGLPAQVDEHDQQELHPVPGHRPGQLRTVRRWCVHRHRVLPFERARVGLTDRVGSGA